MDTKQIKGWKASLEAQCKTLSEKIEALGSDLQKRRQQLDLINKLLDSEAPIGSAPHDAGNEQKARPTAPNPTPDEVKDHVVEILNETNRPMNIKEIHAEFRRRGFRIPGKGTTFNILVHMSREVRKGTGSRIYRTGKGTYALRRRSGQTPPEHRVAGARAEVQ
jgi:hypothetical protein